MIQQRITTKSHSFTFYKSGIFAFNIFDQTGYQILYKESNPVGIW